MRIIERNVAALDWLGASASLLCAVDCIVLPAVLAAAPTLALGETGHWALFAVAAVVALSLPISRARHGSWAPCVLAAVGLAGLGLGHDTLLSPLGGLTLAGAHWLNRRFCGSCVACHAGTDQT
jgi:hypothetical protein